MRCRRYLAWMLATALATASCAATPAERLRVVPLRDSAPTQQLSGLDLETGTRVVIYERDGGVTAGRLVRIDPSGVLIAAPMDKDSPRLVPDAEIRRLGVVVGKSRPARGWIGFVAGALLSLPLSMSMFGDAILVVGGLGAWLGSATGDARVEIRLERP